MKGEQRCQEFRRLFSLVCVVLGGGYQAQGNVVALASQADLAEAQVCNITATRLLSLGRKTTTTTTTRIFIGKT
eukprot:5574833-Amphidinium_carterae.1